MTHAQSKTIIEITPPFRRALDAALAGKNVFITGKAGTGKSTFLQYFRQHCPRRVVVLAPTGVAALNVQGETIHSFFRFKPDVTARKIKRVKGKRGSVYREVDVIVIDEISMVRADLLDYVDQFLRLNGRDESKPFGGAQMVLIGDLYQLPPVVTAREGDIFKTLYPSPYFFDSRVFAEAPMAIIELEKIYRQSDGRFIDILNAIRANRVEGDHLRALNERVAETFSENGKADFNIHLTTTNDMAARINADHLHRLPDPPRSYDARVEGKFERSHYPTDDVLSLAVGAQVMFLNNDSAGRWVNGTLGRVEGFALDDEGEDIIRVRLAKGKCEDVSPHSWDIFHFTYDNDTRSIHSETLGSFTQYPLKLAWAVTIHKSQGKTFDRVVIDMGRGAFSHGQTYVALSRCRTLEGIALTRPLRKGDVWVDWRVVKFMTDYQYKVSQKEMPLETKRDIIQKAIREKAAVEIVYLKTSDIKSRRVITPKKMAVMTYKGHSFPGLLAHCHSRQEERVFRLERILELKPAATPERKIPN